MLNRTRLALESLEDRECPSLTTLVDGQSLVQPLNSLQTSDTSLVNTSDTAESNSRTFQDRTYFFKV
jgi:hypothetical protein